MSEQQRPAAAGSSWGTNTGHGHVWARPDGVKARCGGPGICSVCSRDFHEHRVVIAGPAIPLAPPAPVGSDSGQQPA